MRALKRIRLQLIHQGKKKKNIYLTEYLWDLAKCYRNYLNNCSPSDNLPGPAWLSVANSLLFYKILTESWFFHYSPYHSAVCMHPSPSAASLLNYQAGLLSFHTLMTPKLWRSHCKTHYIPKKMLLFSSLSPVISNTFANSPFYNCATILQPLPAGEIPQLRQLSLPVGLRFRTTRRPDVLSYCFMQDT